MSLFEKLSLMVTTVGLYNCFRFVWNYRRRAGKWPKSSHGRYMMWTALVLGSLFALIISTRLFSDWRGREPIVLVLYVTYVAFTGWLNKLLDISLPEAVAELRRQQEEENEDDESTTDLGPRTRAMAGGDSSPTGNPGGVPAGWAER